MRDAQSRENYASLSSQFPANANHGFEFEKRRQLFVGLHDEMFPEGRCGCHGRHIQIPGPIRSFCALKSFTKTEDFSSEVKTLNRENSHLFVRKWIEHSFRSLIDRTIRECRSEERRVAERHTRKHRLQARKSCIPDARNYRVARRLFLLGKAQF